MPQQCVQHGIRADVLACLREEMIEEAAGAGAIFPCKYAWRGETRLSERLQQRDAGFQSDERIIRGDLEAAAKIVGTQLAQTLRIEAERLGPIWRESPPGGHFQRWGRGAFPTPPNPTRRRPTRPPW